MNLRAVQPSAATLHGTAHLVQGDVQLRFAYFGQPIGQFARRSAAYILFAGAGVVDDLPMRHIAGRQLGKLLQEHRSDGNVSHGQHTPVDRQRDLVNFPQAPTPPSR